MATQHQFPSIQSFFDKEIPVKKDETRLSNLQTDTNDGFSENEVQAALHPALHRWNPCNEYVECDIGSLLPGPGCRALQGRIVNFYQQQTLSKKPQAAKGCLKVVIKDDTGTLMVRLQGFLNLEAAADTCHRRSINTWIGQVMVCRCRLQAPSRPAHLSLDTSHLRDSFRLIDIAWHQPCDQYLP